jgi:hypothetical protein
MTDREQLHQLLNEKFPRFAKHLPFDQRDAIVQLIQFGPLDQPTPEETP